MKRPNTNPTTTHSASAPSMSPTGLRPSTEVKPAMAPKGKPSADEIRRRAYEIFLRRNGKGGSPESDWLQAERELMQARR